MVSGQTVCLEESRKGEGKTRPGERERLKGRGGGTKQVLLLGARLRGRMAAQRSKKGSEKVLERVLGKGFSEGFWKGGLLWVLQ